MQTHVSRSPAVRAHVVLGAALHRRWYLPGDMVRAQVFLECATHATLPALVVAGSSEDEPRVAWPPDPIHNHYDPDAIVSIASPGDGLVVVRRLTAQAVGHCTIYDRTLTFIDVKDATQKSPSGTVGGDAGVMARETTATGLAKSQKRYKLFASPRWDVVEDVALCHRQCVALALTLRLPCMLPSSHTGSVVSFAYALVLEAEWRASGVGASATAPPAQARCVVPIHVLDVTGVMLPLFLASALATHPDINSDAEVARVRESDVDEYDFDARLLPAVPSVAIAAPTQSSLNPRHAGLRTSYTVRQAALAARTNQLAGRCTPVSLVLPLNGIDTLHITLQSSTVALGAALCGSLVPLRSDAAEQAAGKTTQTLVVVRVDGVLEQLECAETRHVTPEVRTAALPDVPHLVALHSHVIERQTWVPLDSSAMDFCFFLPVADTAVVSPTILTDVVTVLWQLRLRFWAATPAALHATQRPGCVDLVVDAASPEVVLPLTVVPPRVPERPRCGCVCHSASRE